MSEASEKEAVLELFNLDRDRVEEAFCHKEKDQLVVDVLLRADFPACPDCGCKEPQIKEYIHKRINHAVLSDRKCILNYRARRYRCPVCHRTYYENNPFCFKKQKISAMTVRNVLNDLKKQNETFTTVAERYHISPTTAASVFDAHVIESRRKLPELMCWDETYAFFHKGENSKYVFTILDFETVEPVDMLPSRKKDYLINYFMAIPKEERQNVKMISTDMYEEYRGVIQLLFPSSYHSVDHYHVSQELGRKVDKVRIRIMKSVDKYLPDSKIQTNEYYLLKTFNWMIFKRPDSKTKDKKLLFDANAEKIMNRKLNRFLNYYDIKVMIEAIHPDLKKAWELKDSLEDFYDDNTYETAPEALETLIRSFAGSGVPEMKEFARTLRNWKEEIINSFIVVKQRHEVDKGTGQVTVSDIRINNGLMENRNSIIKTLKKAANGYTNWQRFRNRCLYVLRINSVPRLNPEIPKKAVKQKKGGK